jgi:hypothetical protein
MRVAITSARRVASVLVGAGLLLAVPVLAGCAALTSRPNAARTGEVRPAITPEQAEAVWARFLAARAADPRKGAEKAALQRVAVTFAAPSRDLEAGALRLDRRTASGKRTSPVVSYGTPTWLVPRVHGYPRWFAVRTAAKVTARGAGAVTETRFLVFVRARAGTPWTQAHEVGVPAALAKAVPGVFVDADGLAETVPTQAGDGLVLAPAAVAKAWAQTVVADPPATAAPVAGETFRRRRLADRDADVLGLGESTAVKYAATPHGSTVFAVRTKDGGALVLFATDDVRSYGPAAGAPAGLKIAVTGDYAALAGATQLRTMTVKRLDLWLAAVPVGEGAVQVVGARSGLISVTGKA